MISTSGISLARRMPILRRRVLLGAAFHGHLLAERVAQPHVDRAFQLAFKEGGVEDLASVVGGNDLAHVACLLVEND
jgi:hypothetical protein